MNEVDRQKLDFLRRDLESMGTQKHLEDCGIVIHLEQIQKVAKLLKEFHEKISEE